MTRHRVFLSYSSADRALADFLCDHLEAEGVSCWIAPRDVQPGQRYAEAILEGIDDCDLFLILFSEHANTSPHVCNEIEDAASKGKRILLVRTDSANPSDNRQISLFLRSHQWFDASSAQLADAMPKLIANVRRLLHDPSEVSHPESRLSHGRGVAGAPAVQGSSSSATANRSIGVDVGASKIRVYVVDLDSADVSAEQGSVRTELVRMRNVRALLEQIRDMLVRVVEEQFSEAPPAGIGIAVPGQVEMRSGTLKFGPNLFAARNVPFKTYLSKALPRIPIRVDNEVRCATRCELHIGVGRGFDSFTCMFVGHGVGSGLVIDRRVVFGHNFCAGEVGHTKIAPTGPPCACGQIGCLETFVKADAVVARASGKAIDRRTREFDTLLTTAEDGLTPELIVEAIEQGDEAAIEVAKEVGGYLGLGISNYLNLVNPAAVVIGGGIMNGFFFHMIDEVTDTVRRNALAEVANTPIVQSAHSEDGVAIGAGLMFHRDDHWPFDHPRQSLAGAHAA